MRVRRVRPVFPSNFHAPISAGARAPVKLKTEAPDTETGFPRRLPLAESCRRIFTVTPEADSTSSAGAVGGMGEGVGTARTFRPKVIFWALLTVAVPSTSFAKSLASIFRLFFALFFAATAAEVRTPGSTPAIAVEKSACKPA